MPAPKWLVVAKNEYNLQTSRIRKIRPYFPYLAIGFLAVYVAFITPRIVGTFIDDLLAFFLSQVAIAMVQIILFVIFINFMIIPIIYTLQEEQTGKMEIFLAAPIKPGDVLLGEFLGKIPITTIFFTVITGLFTAALNPLGINIVQMVIIILVFAITLLSALWIGTVIAALLRTRLGKTAHGRDIGRALALIIALPLVGLVYAIQFGGLLQALADPQMSGTVKNILGLLPSSWGAEVIVSFAQNPGNISAVGLETLTRFGGLVAFFVATLWLGGKAANHAYSLEPTTFIASRARPDGAFYKTIRSLGGGGNFGTILVSIFKDYSRRLENLTYITFIMCLLVLQNIFLLPRASVSPDEPPVALIMAQLMLPMIAVMVAGEVTVRGKDNLFLYRKAPSGVGRFVKAMLVKSWIMVVPIASAITAITTLINPQTTFISLLINTGSMSLIVGGTVAFVIGLFLLNPAFSKKSVKLKINSMIAMFVSIGLFVVSLLVFTMGFQTTEPIGGILYIQLLQILLSWVLGIVFLYLGKRKLSRIE